MRSPNKIPYYTILCVVILLAVCISVNSSLALLLTSNTASSPASSLPTFSIQNTSASVVTGTHMAEYPQAFAQGAVPSGSGLSLNITGFGPVGTQLDCTVTHAADGSCKLGTLTINAPNLSAGTSLIAGTYSLAAGGGAPVNISTTCSSIPRPGGTGTWGATVTITETAPTSQTFTEDICALLSADLANKAAFTGHITGTTLTIDSLTSGTIAIGQWVTGAGVPYGTAIIAGSGTSWTLNFAPASTVSSEAMTSAAYMVWRSGPQVTEIRLADRRLDTNTASYFRTDLALHADGSVMLDAHTHNDRTLTANGGPITYNETIAQTCAGCPSNVTWSGVVHDQYRGRHDVVWSNGPEKHNIKRDMAAFVAVGLLPPIDLQASVGNALSLYPTVVTGAAFTGPFPTANIDTSFGGGGGDAGFGPFGMFPGPAAVWVITQDPSAYTYVKKLGDAGVGVPWNYWDPTKYWWANSQTYPALWTAGSCGAGLPTQLTQCHPATSSNQPWSMSGDFPISHEPDLSYIPYLATGSHLYYDQIQSQANFSQLYMWGCGDDASCPRTFDYANGHHDLLMNGYVETREQAWTARQNLYADVVALDNAVGKSIFHGAVTEGLSFIKSKINNTTPGNAHFFDISAELTGTPHGMWRGVVSGPCGTNSWNTTFGHSYAIVVTGFAAQNGFADATPILDWSGNWLVQATHPHTGYFPYHGVGDGLGHNDNTTGAYLTDWSLIESHPCTIYDGQGNDSVARFPNGNWPEVVLGLAIAPVISHTSNSGLRYTAMQSYVWLLGQQVTFAATYAPTTVDNVTGAGGFFNDPEHQFRPIMPDGTKVTRNNMQYATNPATVGAGTLTSNNSGANILATYGTGTSTLTGGTGGDLLYAGTVGNNTLTAGLGNQFLFGPMETAGLTGACSGTNRLIDGTGNNLLVGSTICGANTYEFGTNNSGQDTIGFVDNNGTAVGEFRPGTDFLLIKSTLDGNSFASAAAFLATGSTVSGSCVFSLGGGNTITTTGVACASLGAGDVTIN